MGFWFDEKDDNKTVWEHTVGKHTPDSIRHEAEQELLNRGFSRKEISDYQMEHDD